MVIVFLIISEVKDDQVIIFENLHQACLEISAENYVKAIELKLRQTHKEVTRNSTISKNNDVSWKQSSLPRRRCIRQRSCCQWC